MSTLALVKVMSFQSQKAEIPILKVGDIRVHNGRSYIVDRIYYDKISKRWIADENMLIDL
jgi:hypothetical protein